VCMCLYMCVLGVECAVCGVWCMYVCVCMCLYMLSPQKSQAAASLKSKFNHITMILIRVHEYNNVYRPML